MFFFLCFFFVLCVKTVFLLRSFEVLSWAETSCGKAWQLSLNVVFTCVSVVLPLLLLLDCVLPWPRLCCCTDANAATVALLKSPVGKKKKAQSSPPTPHPPSRCEVLSGRSSVRSLSEFVFRELDKYRPSDPYSLLPPRSSLSVLQQIVKTRVFFHRKRQSSSFLTCSRSVIINWWLLGRIWPTKPSNLAATDSRIVKKIPTFHYFNVQSPRCLSRKHSDPSGKKSLFK